MKKQELVHLHCLVAEFKEYYESEVGDTIECEEHARLGLGSTSLHRDKDAHKEATLALLGCLVSQIKSENDDYVSQPTG